MKKRYSIPAEKCEQSLLRLYECAAVIAGIKLTEKSIFDCRKICVTKQVQDAIIKYYTNREQLSAEEIGTLLLCTGPKANLVDTAGYEFEIEPGFVSEMD